MKHYIDKSALVAEIEKQRNTYISEPSKYKVLSRILSFLNTLEVKEVDLDKEFCDYLEKNFRIGMTGILLSNNGEPINTIKLFDFAKHFFKLGMQVSNKAQKGE